MKTKVTFLFFILIVTFSCIDNSKPEKFIPKEKFINILTDIYVAEGIVEYMKKLKGKEVLFNFLLDSTFKIYNVDSLTFQNNYIYYQKNLDEMSKISQAIIDTLKNRNKVIVKSKKLKLK